MATTQTGPTSPAQFVRYAPELDALSAQFEEHLEAVIAGGEQYVANSVAAEGVRRAVRFAHAKGYGPVSAEVEILDGLPPGYLASNADAYRTALVAELKQRPFEFDLQVQLSTNLEHMPIQDVTVEWPEAHSPFVTARQGAFTGAGHFRCRQPRKHGRVVLHPVAGHRGACATRRDPASAQRSVPALVDCTPSAQPSGAAGAAKRARGGRRATSQLVPTWEAPMSSDQVDLTTARSGFRDPARACAA